MALIVIVDFIFVACYNKNGIQPNYNFNLIIIDNKAS